MIKAEKGRVFEDSITFTQKQVVQFAELTGDSNPIHIDKDFASKSEYGRTIVQGTFSVTAFSHILTTVFPGPGSIVIHRESLFVRPVFTDQPYKILMKILSLDEESKTVIMKCYLKNRENKICVVVTLKLKNENIFSQ
ncbi:MAG: MaoC family dehydratase N-terminal domain-containing protein [Balneolaceae bacterium]|nr:MaoC family dehydratase N-terminal domain-containing protein [Balneolaceae bacterium]